MKIACIQMDVLFCQPEENLRQTEALIRKAMKDQPDVLVLPEMWNTGFFPNPVTDTCSRECLETISLLAKEFHVNIVAGSIAEIRDGKVFNTAYVFDRDGQCIASYDKTHLFSPMGEDRVFTPGDRLCRFSLDGASCGILICYDLRFPELARSLCISGLDMLFVVAQWPEQRVHHLTALCTARAIENQALLVCCNGCGSVGDTKFGGNSAIYDPLGKVLVQADDAQKIICAQWDFSQKQIPFNVFADRRPELYRM